MAYASVADMVGRFGSQEMIRLSTPAGQDLEAVQAEAVERALIDASSLVDSYLRKRYAVPVELPPDEVRRAVCMLARYDLSMGEQKEPSEQVRLARKEVIEWLADIATGKVLLDLQEVAAGDNSFAEVSVRGQTLGGLPT